MDPALFTHLQAIGMADPKAAEVCEVWFGCDAAELERRCGRFVRGPRKGKLRGWMVWCECRREGFCYARGHHLPRGAKLGRFYELYGDMVRAMTGTLDEFLRAAKRVDLAEQARLLPDAWLATAILTSTATPDEMTILMAEAERRERCTRA